MRLRSLSKRSFIARIAAAALLTVLVVTALLVGQHAPGSQAAVSYPFPGRAENLKPGQYWWMGGQHAAGVQGLGYDLGMTRFDAQTKTWNDLHDDIPADETPRSQNDHLLVYGQPAYAVADGEVVRCWRNAPENPKPGVVLPNVVDPRPKNIPATLADKPKIAGGGNHLWVRHNNGDLALYAHFQTGSIPANLCPIPDAEFIELSEMDLPAGNRPRVTKGQLIGKVGNSGASGGPHLHTHLQTGDPDDDGTAEDAVPMPFNGGYIKDTTLTQDVLADWKRMNGVQLTAPPQPVILPDYSKGFSEIARHGVPTDKFQFTFDHITKSGYRPVWLDGYEVNGINYSNLIFRPADGTPWVARAGMTDPEYADEFTLRVSQGYRPLQVESYLDGGAIRYAVIFVKQAGPNWVTYHGKNDVEQGQLFNTLLGQGFIPRNISVVSVAGQRSYTTFYEKVPVSGLVTVWNMTPAQYQTQYTDNAAAGRKLTYLNAYQMAGGPRFTAIWISPLAGNSVARHGETSASYQDEWEHWTGLGYLTKLVTGYEEGDAPRFAGLWRK